MRSKVITLPAESRTGIALMADTESLPIVPVLLPIPTDRPYSYLAPTPKGLPAGTIVQVPLGPRLVSGIVWDGPEEPIARAKLKAVERVFDCPPINDVMRKFIDRVAVYNVARPGMVARMVLRAPAALEQPAPLLGLRHAGVEPDRMTKARAAVLRLAREGTSWTKSGLAHAAGVTPSVVDGLVRQGVFETVEIAAQPAVSRPDTGYVAPQFTAEQGAAAAELRRIVTERGYSATLLDGITGSGKTEVYFEAIAQCLEAGRQALILLPEIALTASFLGRFEARFGARPAEWHSEVGAKGRERCWRQSATGEIRVVAGARSALFLPFENLGLIVVDEEHDPAYKQEERVVYHGRDMAVLRAHLGGFPVVLASATPSIESRVNADKGRYRHIRLQQRYADGQLPAVETIDMRRTPPQPGRFLSPPLLRAIRQTLARSEQVLLFLNRRGYAPLTLCRVCGHRFECPDCSAWLVEHRFRGMLQCHHCGHAEPAPQACPSCGTLDHLAACGPGVERLAEEILAVMPDARTIVLSSDITGGASRLRLELEAIANGATDIVIGTQLVAKGHNFPLITCVGVVDADLGLANGDPRAAERTFQLLSQVTGRAGRAGQASRGYLQTFQPLHPVIQAIVSGDSESFYACEIEARRATGMPPFGRLASLIVTSTDRAVAESHARTLRARAPCDAAVNLFGPAEAPLAMIRGRYRFRLLVRTPRGARIQDYIRDMVANAPKPRGNTRVHIDIDPQSFV
jgi:primosomal protein N' (replication factor Y) (superfamily II helicase)